MLCHSCEAVQVNGILVHEHGCPDRYRNESVPCFYCGFDYLAESLDEYRNHTRMCPDCRETEK